MRPRPSKASRLRILLRDPSARRRLLKSPVAEGPSPDGFARFSLRNELKSVDAATVECRRRTSYSPEGGIARALPASPKHPPVALCPRHESGHAAASLRSSTLLTAVAIGFMRKRSYAAAPIGLDPADPFVAEALAGRVHGGRRKRSRWASRPISRRMPWAPACGCVHGGRIHAKEALCESAAGTRKERSARAPLARESTSEA